MIGNETTLGDTERDVFDRQNRPVGAVEALGDMSDVEKRGTGGSALPPCGFVAASSAGLTRAAVRTLLARRDLDQLRELLLRHRRGGVLERDGVLDDGVETYDLVGVDG